MARKIRHHLPPGAMGDDDLTPRSLTKQEFARRLMAMMQERNWTQADLARETYGETVNSKGHRLAKGRDNISKYVNGLAFPTPKHLRKLADAFGVEPQDLLPNTVEAAIDRDVPAMELKVAAGHPNKAWVRINALLSIDTAAKIFDLARNDKIE